MARLFVYVGAEQAADIPPVTEGPWPSAIAVLVFQSATGRLGFDEDESAVLLDALLADSLLIDWSRSPEIHRPNPTTNRRLVRRHAGRGLFALIRPTVELLNETKELERQVKQRAANEVRARLGRPTIQLAPGRLLDWGAVESKPSLAILKFLCQETSVTCIWRHSEWGIYATALAKNAEAISRWLEDASADCAVTFVNSVRELPQW